ncbi:hypothetical protein UZ36_05440 [Candidatus Nitromaritima sp. SCGC AAA799-C22]|nr:hypothetical protein UZ36_05440 [Candidatus Nitromaritima sp. SCGC AAA799-C22]
MEKLTRGRVAKLCEINIEAVRYYEQRRLIGPPDRNASGYRVYAEEDVHKIRFIKNAQKLGFTLEEIGELLKLRVRKNGKCEPVMVRAQKKLDEVEIKIRDLQSMQAALKDLIACCKEAAPTGDCPILSCFESGKEI